MIVFDENWFKKEQKKLLWFANTFIGRRVLGINSDKRILAILPNSITWAKGKEYQTEFHSKGVYATRLYRNLKPVWWGMHSLDEMLLDKLSPSLGFGFSTLTAYPDPNPETNTVDGYASRDGVDEAIATIIAGAGNLRSDTSTNPYARLQCSATNNQFAACDRHIYLFKTDAIGTDSISAAVLSLTSALKINQGGGANPDYCVVSSNPASNTALAVGDYQTLGSTDLATRKTYASWSTNGTTYNDMTLNAAGIAAISKTGITKFGGRISFDLDGTGATWGSGAIIGFRANMAENTGTDKDPKLVVTHAAAGTGALSSLLMGCGY